MKKTINLQITNKGGQPCGVLLEALEYNYNGNLILVPCGFKTDFASIPRIFWAILSPLGRHTIPSIIHDYLYSDLFKISRKEADLIFYKSMLDYGVEIYYAKIMYWCVSLFGKKHFKG